MNVFALFTDSFGSKLQVVISSSLLHDILEAVGSIQTQFLAISFLLLHSNYLTSCVFFSCSFLRRRAFPCHTNQTALFSLSPRFLVCTVPSAEIQTCSPPVVLTKILWQTKLDSCFVKRTGDCRKAQDCRLQGRC